MNPAHIHLMLNHFGIIGSIFVAALLAVAMVRRSRELTMVAFACVTAIALISIVVYFTGEPASHQVEKYPEVSAQAIHQHEEVANFGFAAIECVGALALAGLWLFRKEPVPRWFLMITLVGSLLTIVAMFYTANSGRDIRHPEVRSRVSS